MSASVELEQRVRAACERGDSGLGATLVLEELGADVLRVIHARFQREQLSAEVFSMFSHDLWRGLPTFRFRCSLRAWVFMLARNAGHRFLDREQRALRRQVPLSQAPEFALLASRLCSDTLSRLDTPAEQRLRALRDALPEADQLLLTLRVDRELEFAEIAVVTLGNDQPGADELQRETARLRKRFQLIRQRLRKGWSE